MTLTRDQRNIAKGREEGRLEGLETGREEGRLEGLEEGKEAGRAEGKLESRIELIRNMLKTELPMQTICDVLEISEGEFRQFCSAHDIEL